VKERSNAMSGYNHQERRINGIAHPMKSQLFVIPSLRGDGFQASIRGHLLELADPNSAHGLAPTPDDLRIASIASDFAWLARRFLRDRGLNDYVSVTARQSRSNGSAVVDGVDVSLTVSKQVAAVRKKLSAVLEHESAGTFPHVGVRLHVDAEEPDGSR
jgi:hypothetical protein